MTDATEWPSWPPRSARRPPHDRRTRAPPGPRARPPTDRLSSLVGRAGIAIPFVIALVALSLISDSFLRFQNLANILDQQAGIIIVACAGTLVLIAGGLDLSIGASTAWPGRTATLIASSVSTPAGIAAGLALGAGGRPGQRHRRDPLPGQRRSSRTLAMSFVVAGIAAIVTQGNLVVVFDHPDFQDFAATKIGGITSAAWMMIGIAILAAILLGRTTFGRYVYATGGNIAGGPAGRGPGQRRARRHVHAEWHGRRPGRHRSTPRGC